MKLKCTYCRNGFFTVGHHYYVISRYTTSTFAVYDDNDHKRVINLEGVLSKFEIVE